MFHVRFEDRGSLARTLNVCEVSDMDPEPMGGEHTRTHESGWTITGEVHEDWFTWVNDFKATHPTLGEVKGNFEYNVYATSEEAYNHFYENHEPMDWDYWDI